MILVAHFESLRASEERAVGPLPQLPIDSSRAIPTDIQRAAFPRYMPPGGLGFDIVKFDEEVVKSPDGESCKDAIRRQWGEAGLAIIVELMQ